MTIRTLRPILYTAALIVAAAIAAVAYNTTHTQPADTPAGTGGKAAGGGRRGPLHVNVEVLQPQVLTDQIRVTGLLLPDEEVGLSFETSGKITEICFEEGARVRRGQLLARVNHSHQQAQLRRLQAQLPLAQDRVRRQDALLQRDAVSREALQQAEAELEALRAEIEAVEAQISFTRLCAPFDGVVGLRQVSVGAYATPSTVVATLTRVSPLKVEFSVPERYAGQLQSGQAVQFTVDGHLQPFSASVYATQGAVDRSTHSLTVRALYPNSDGRLLPGRYASVTLTRETIGDAIAVPAEAIIPEMGRDKVFLYRSGRAVPAEIVSGLRTESRVQALQGVAAGDTLIVSGTMQLRTDLPVVIDSGL